MLITTIRWITLLLVALSSPLHAASVSFTDLPANIQTCHFSGTCFVETRSSTIDIPNTTSSTDNNGVANPYAMNAYNLFRNGVLKSLLQYHIVAPSGDSIGIPYTGSVWLEVASSYNLTTGNPVMTLYLDKVTPEPVNQLNGHSNGLNIDISMTSQGLLGGSLNQSIGCCTFPSESGNMVLLGDFGGSALLPCVADGCFSAAQLNLLYLDYRSINNQAVLNFNPADSRGGLFNITTSFETTRSQAYYVSTVPVPASVWLLLSGLSALSLLIRRK